MDKKVFFGIVFFLIIVTGGILIWQLWYWPTTSKTPASIACTQEAKVCPDGSTVSRTEPNCEFAECPASISEIITPLLTEISDWSIYTNQELGLSFEYPKEWGSIQVGSSKAGGIYPLISTNIAIAKAWYHQPSGKLIFVSKGSPCVLYGGDQSYEQTLIVLDQKAEKGKIVLQNPTTTGGDYCREISAVNLSPDGKYAYVLILGYEEEEPRIINIETGVNIIQGSDIRFGEDTIYNNIVWSPNNNLMAVKSEYFGFSGEGVNGIFLSADNKPEKLSLIFSVTDKETADNYAVYSLHFTDNNKLTFVVGRIGEDGILKDVNARYEYNVQTKELKKLSS